MADLSPFCLLVVIAFVCCACIWDTFAAASLLDEPHPVKDFSRHTLVKPRIYHGREKRQISTTREGNGLHTHHLIVDLDVDGKNYTLDLKLNTDLIPKGYFRSHQKNGANVVHKPTKEEVDLCHYHGKIRGIPESWAAISTCEGGISGVVYDGAEMHYVEKSPMEGDGTHFVYKHSHLVEDGNKTCGYTGTDFHNPYAVDETRKARRKRSAEPRIRGPYNASKQSRYVELVLVVDNREFKEFNEDKTKVENRCKQIANIINGLYAPLNIFIALVGVEIWTEYDNIDFSTEGDITLTNFLHYRREKLIKNHPNDNAQLLTKFNFASGVVGKALKGPICTYEYSGGVSTDHSSVIGLVATTIAHEMGHNFGMEHDNSDCVCPDDRCIMAPSSSSVAPAHWSSCSLEYLAMAFEHGMDYCLRNKPEALFDSPVCGNGFVEEGEQCDCGLPEHCDNTCCNATTCTLYANASCATGSCCDLNTCRPKAAGTLCRSADYECDLPEYCTGESEYCPADIYKMDTELCDGGKAYCFHGFCRTRSDQCKLLWGMTGKSSDEQCYKMNTKGNRHGNCGYNKLNQSYFKCEEENVLCGMLHCRHLNERLEFGMESVAILSHSFINLKGSIVPCRTAIVDLGINQIDPGLAPDGAKCGDEKMCVNQKCMAVASLRKDVKSCPNDCNGNGICNSMGHCHCNVGFAPPDCTYPGPGGSNDSGPASDPNATKGFRTALFIVFLGIIPAAAIVMFLFYYTRRNISLTSIKSPAPLKSPSKSRGPPPFSPQSTKTGEDNHSLLHNPENALQKDFCGHFKGFTLTPIKKAEPEPIRSAPAPPVAPPVAWTKSPNVTRSNTNAETKPVFPAKPSVTRAQSFKPNAVSSGIANANSASVAPALPPPNPGSSARPIISSPILENSTCTAKELISPLRNAPKVPLRPAPEKPASNKENKRPLSSPDAVINTVTFADDVFKKPVAKENSGGSALNRIASFLTKNNDKKPVSNTNSLPRAKKVLDKDALRSIEISSPIPQTDIEIAVTALPVDTEENKAVVMRAQSMRGKATTPRPAIPTFGSMRQPPGFKRPLSIPSAHRPKSPPPPRPVDEVKKEDKIPGLPGYQKPTVNKQVNQYDDCLNESTLSNIREEKDNIYAVIEDGPLSSPESKPSKSNSTSDESMGLLGEIVSEIQNRNFDSIYSTSTLARKKKEKEAKKLEQEKKNDSSEIYMNTPAYKAPESVYSNMSSSTSSGYIHPSAVNPPVKPDKPEETKNQLSTFKAETKPATKTTKSNPTPPKPSPTESKTPPTKTNTTKTLNRQTTPPNLRTRKPSPTRQAPASPKVVKPTSNSPDLVTSCSPTAAAKSPDVCSGTVKKPAVFPAKPKTVPKVNKSVSVKNEKPPVSAKIQKAVSDAGTNKSMPTGARTAAKQLSNVASLQQKFENKPPMGTKAPLVSVVNKK